MPQACFNIPFNVCWSLPTPRDFIYEPSFESRGLQRVLIDFLFHPSCGQNSRPAQSFVAYMLSLVAKLRTVELLDRSDKQPDLVDLSLAWARRALNVTLGLLALVGRPPSRRLCL